MILVGAQKMYVNGQIFMEKLLVLPGIIWNNADKH